MRRCPRRCLDIPTPGEGCGDEHCPEVVKPLVIEQPRFPTFDEWFKLKYGHTFEELHMSPTMTHSYSLRALTVALRDYTTEMVRASLRG